MTASARPRPAERAVNAVTAGVVRSAIPAISPRTAKGRPQQAAKVANAEGTRLTPILPVGGKKMAEADKEVATTPGRGQRVEERVRFARDSLPGRRDGLPRGALG